MVPTTVWKGNSSEKGVSDGINRRQQGTWSLSVFSIHSSHLHSRAPSRAELLVSHGPVQKDKGSRRLWGPNCLPGAAFLFAGPSADPSTAAWGPSALWSAPSIVTVADTLQLAKCCPTHGSISLGRGGGSGIPTLQLRRLRR